MTIRTLVLSGGGGRGAFHAGVYKYLMKQDKAGLDENHTTAWVPDIIVGTSIGAVNGAAITQGMSAEELEQTWLTLRSHHVEAIPPGMSRITRGVVNSALKQMIGSALPQVTPDKATSPSDAWQPAPVLPGWFNSLFLGQWSNLLDTGPLKDTLTERMKIDPDKLSASDKTLLISTTNVQTGEEHIFSNKPIKRIGSNDPHEKVSTPITVNRIVASCSIPMVYPWTQDEDGDQTYHWDGAVVANTPLASAFHAVADRPIEEDMEIVVVLMTPWVEKGKPARIAPLPTSFMEAGLRTLDWALLSSFRNELDKTKLYRRLAEEDRRAGREQRYRYVKDIMIVAPEEFQSIARIVTYEESASRELIELGYEKAKAQFEDRFGAHLVG